MRDILDLEYVIYLDGRSPIPKHIVRQEDEAHRSHMLVALGLVDGHNPLRLRMHVLWKMWYSNLIVSLYNSDGDFLMFYNPQPYMWLPHGWRFVLHEFFHEGVVKQHPFSPCLDALGIPLKSISAKGQPL